MKKSIIVFMLFFCSIASFAQFGKRIDITKFPAGPVDVKSFDLDGDGNNDIICASERDNKISWYKNLGSGNFSTQQIISSNTNNVKHIDVADIDGDGDLDIVSGAHQSPAIVWYENIGNGIFGGEKNCGYITKWSNFC